MKLIVFLSEFMIPLVMFYIIGYGILQKRPVYDDFITGAKNGIKTVFDVMPTLIGLMVGVGILRASGLLTFLTDKIGSLTEQLGLPAAVVPPMLVRIFSSSAATGLVLDIFKQFGVDSYEGMLASIMMSCTETIFYTMSVYFLAVKVTKTRWTIAGALVSTLAGVVASVLLATVMK